jgi:hypothetical protein
MARAAAPAPVPVFLPRMADGVREVLGPDGWVSSLGLVIGKGRGRKGGLTVSAVIEITLPWRKSTAKGGSFPALHRVAARRS